MMVNLLRNGFTAASSLSQVCKSAGQQSGRLYAKTGGERPSMEVLEGCGKTSESRHSEQPSGDEGSAFG
jgi:hypothetical protein